MANALRLGLGLALIVLIAGCASPRDLCLRQANQDVRDIQRELDERRGNVQRGYRIERIEVPQLLRMMCPGPGGVAVPCQRWSTVTEEVHYPINRDLERERIALLERQLTREEAAAVRASAECRAAHPEE